MAKYEKLSKPLNFQVIENKEDFQYKAAWFEQQYRDTGAQFNQFVRSTVYYFYHGANYNVAVINRLLEVAYHSKGLNYTRLLAYLSQVIPHKAIDVKKGKDEGTGKEMRHAPRFGELKKGASYDWAEALAFMSVNLQWFKYGREVSHAAFNLSLVAEKVAKQLLENGADVEAFITHLKADIVVLADKKAKKQAKG